MTMLRAFDKHWRQWGRWAAMVGVLGLSVIAYLTRSRPPMVAALVLAGLTVPINLAYVVPIARLLVSERRRRQVAKRQRLVNVLHFRGELDALTLGDRAGFKPGTVRPHLATLERDGLVVSRWSDRGPRRRLYRLTLKCAEPPVLAERKG